MKIERAASIPIIVADPYFSIWSKSDKLYDEDLVHWAKMRQKIRGYAEIDGVIYRFMGKDNMFAEIEQVYVDVTATATEYLFENELIRLKVRFVTPIIGDDLLLSSRPCTYVDFDVVKKYADKVKVFVDFSDELVTTEKTFLIGDDLNRESIKNQPAFKYSYMGRAYQKPLGNSGDNIGIDWGYLYIASDCENTDITFLQNDGMIRFSADLSDNAHSGMIVAYDDLISINYFGNFKKAYWAEVYGDILNAIGAAFDDKSDVLSKAERIDDFVYNEAIKVGGEDYALLCVFSYRHAFAAHKLIKDDKGEFVFLSKENDSNGCIGTVDVSYPSVPLFLLFDTEYVKGMLRPVFKFAKKPIWEYDFAPHDVGRYPYATGQVYGLNPEKWDKAFCGFHGAVFPPFYMFPKGSEIYDLKYQMPVEECGNMLILTAVVCKLDGDISFALENMDLLKKWTAYLTEFGEDPGEQLCTDDFAGHLSHNVNLSAKAIMGIEAYSRILDMAGECDKAKSFHEKAVEMAKSWENRACLGDHYALSFGNEDSWSLKYNLIWDKFFESKLFNDDVFKKEIDFYLSKVNEYGVPLDCRKNYTKSDWILWCAAFANDNEKMNKLIAPVANYIRNTKTRVPFSDWYDTITSEYVAFIARSVQGGIFMPILIKKKD